MPENQPQNEKRSTVERPDVVDHTAMNSLERSVTPGFVRHEDGSRTITLTAEQVAELVRLRHVSLTTDKMVPRLEYSRALMAPGLSLVLVEAARILCQAADKIEFRTPPG